MTLDKKVIYSNLPKGFNFMEPTETVATVFCPVEKSNRRQVSILSDDFILFVASYNQNITNRIFKHYIDSIRLVTPILVRASEEILKIDIQKSKRLKHNLVNHVTNIHQELYRLVSQDDLQKSKTKQVAKIEDSIRKRPTDAAYVYLRVLKGINFMKAEFDVFEMLNTKTPFLDFNNHSLHKVVMLALTPFWLDFLERKIAVSIEPCNHTVYIDYKSFSVCLAHIFDNSIKYCAPNSELEITFNAVGKWFVIYFTMTSLSVDDDEIQEIFKENYSGRLAKECELSGSGIGMYIIEKLVKMNKGTVEFKRNIDPSISFNLEGVPFCKNQIIVTFIR